MLQPMHLLVKSKGTFEKQLGLAVAVLRLVQQGQHAHGLHMPRVHFTKAGPGQSDILFGQRYGIGVLFLAVELEEL